MILISAQRNRLKGSTVHLASCFNGWNKLFHGVEQNIPVGGRPTPGPSLIATPHSALAEIATPHFAQSKNGGEKKENIL